MTTGRVMATIAQGIKHVIVGVITVFTGGVKPKALHNCRICSYFTALTNWEAVVGLTTGFMITIGLVAILRVDRKQSNVQVFIVCFVVWATLGGFSSCFDLIIQLKYNHNVRNKLSIRKV